MTSAHFDFATSLVAAKQPRVALLTHGRDAHTPHPTPIFRRSAELLPSTFGVGLGRCTTDDPPAMRGVKTAHSRALMDPDGQYRTAGRAFGWERVNDHQATLP